MLTRDREDCREVRKTPAKPVQLRHHEDGLLPSLEHAEGLLNSWPVDVLARATVVFEPRNRPVPTLRLGRYRLPLRFESIFLARSG